MKHNKNNDLNDFKNQKEGLSMSSKIQRWGNSLGVRIPHKLAKNMSIYDGSEVEIIEEQNGILIRPINADPTLDELLSQVTDDNKPDFIDWGQPEGKEVW